MSTEPRKKKDKDQPQKKTYTVQLPNAGAAKVTVTHSMEEIEVAAKYDAGLQAVPGTTYLVPIKRKLRDKSGEPITAKVRVQGVKLRIRLDDRVLEARACCKPPDVFNTQIGLRQALRRIFKLDSGISLDKYEPGHVATITEKVGGKKSTRTVWIKGGRPVVDKTVTPKLSGTDRQELLKTVIRGGPRKDRIKKVPETTKTSETTGAAVG